MVRSLALVLTLASLSGCRAPKAAAPPSQASTAIDFGDVTIGQSDSRTFQLRLGGSSPVTLQADADLPPGISVDTGQGPLAPGDFRTVTVTFAPRHPGPVSGRFEVRGGKRVLALVDVKANGAGLSLVTDPPDGLDFGPVDVGAKGNLVLRVMNPIDRVEQVVPSTGSDAFQVQGTPVLVKPGEWAEVPVTFLPVVQGPRRAILVLAPCAGCEGAVTRTLTGTGGSERVFLVPSSLDFGVVPPGTLACRQVSVEDRGDPPIGVESVAPDDAFTASEAFDLVDLREVSGTFPPVVIYSFQVCFHPWDARKFSGALSVHFQDVPALVLDVSGSGGPPGLVVDPPELDLGVTSTAVTRTVTLSDGGAGAVLGPVQLVGDDPAFSMEFPDGDPQGRDLASGAVHVAITMRGALGRHEGQLVVSRQGGDPVTVPIRGWVVEGSPCEVSAPGELTFATADQGLVSTGQRFEIEATYDCWLWGFEMLPAGDGAFRIEGNASEPLKLPFGVAWFTVTWFPHLPGSEAASLRFFHLGSEDPTIVKLYGTTPGPHLDVYPDPVDFGEIPVGSTVSQQVSIQNDDDFSFRVGGNVPPRDPAGDVALSADSSPSLSITKLPPLPHTIEVGSATRLTVRFQPTEVGPIEGTVHIWLQNASAPILVPIKGQGR